MQEVRSACSDPFLKKYIWPFYLTNSVFFNGSIIALQSCVLFLLNNKVNQLYCIHRSPLPTNSHFKVFDLSVKLKINVLDRERKDS